MTTEELVFKVKAKLNLTDTTVIEDVIQEALNYCNLKELPDALEPFARKKVKDILNYEAQNGKDNVFDVKSVSAGDTSYTFNVDTDHSKDSIYGLSDLDKKILKQFRRTRK